MGGNTQYVSREEFDIYDGVKLGSGLMFFGSLLSALMGKGGLCAASDKSKCHQASKMKRSVKLCKILKLHIFATLVVGLCVLGMHHQAERIMHDKQIIDMRKTSAKVNQSDFAAPEE